MRAKIERIKTGISGLDEILNGGIPKGSVVLLSGPAGSGKTILGMQFIVNGAKVYNERGVYISFEENRDDLIEQASLFGWDIQGLEKKGMVRLINVDKERVFYLERILEEIKNSFNPKRIVIDSLTFYYTYGMVYTLTREYMKSKGSMATEKALKYASDLAVRSTIFNLVSRLKNLGYTALLISEGDEKRLSKDGVSEFISDGIILIQYLSIASEIFSNIEVKKLRKTPHKKGIYPVYIRKNGIEIGQEEIGMIK